MIDLLLPEDKKTIKKEILRRYLNLVGLCFFVLIIVEIVFLLILYFLADSFYENSNNRLDAAKTVAESKNLELLEEKVNDINGLLLSVKIDEKSPTDITGNISMILDILPDSIKIESFSFETNKVLIRGHSETRSELLDFITDLEKIDCGGSVCFSKVALPVSNLLEEKDFDFLLAIDLNQKYNDK